jgi:hypothetical protein
MLSFTKFPSKFEHSSGSVANFVVSDEIHEDTTKLFVKALKVKNLVLVRETLNDLAYQLFRRGDSLFSVAHALKMMRPDFASIVEEAVLHAYLDFRDDCKRARVSNV